MNIYVLMNEFLTLGNSDLKISRVGFGSWAIGGEWEWGWGPQQDSDSIRALHHAFDSGVNWVDTAPVYGLGHSEKVVGRALRESGADVYIFTKCGFRWNDAKEITPNLTAKSIREEVEASLDRLGREVIDLYQIHWPNPEGQIEEAAETLFELKSEGKIRWVGVSNFSVNHFERIKEIGDVVSLQPEYSMISRDVEAEVLPYCARHGIGCIAYSPMGSGMLSGKMTRERISKMSFGDWRKQAAFTQEPQLSKNLELVDRLRTLSADVSCSIGALAVSWIFRKKCLKGAILGMRNVDQVALASEVIEMTLSEELLSQIHSCLSESART
ncbi:MAG: aldo/keto reductase [Opitutales bacterium]|nr:aldo/keto reductase [Opitutales bacterium]